MKYLKYYENMDIDPFGEEDWDEVEPDGTFLTWLKRKYPDKNSWDKIKQVNCSNNNLTSLEGIENLRNLEVLNCSNNNLTSLEGIENLSNLKHLYCFNNNFSNGYKNYLKKHCKENKIIFYINE
jgi:Leucine-rich repeat (LRR) protein